MCNLRENIGQFDIMIRFYIAIFLIVLAVNYNEYLILVLPIIIIYTALKRKCFIYGLLGINRYIYFDNYYKSLLVTNNPSSFLIFDINGEIIFKNCKAKNELNEIINIKDLDIPHKNKEYISANKNVEFEFMYQKGKYECKVNFKYLFEEQLILVYFTNLVKI